MDESNLASLHLDADLSHSYQEASRIKLFSAISPAFSTFQRPRIHIHASNFLSTLSITPVVLQVPPSFCALMKSQKINKTCILCPSLFIIKNFSSLNYDLEKKAHKILFPSTFSCIKIMFCSSEACR